MNNIMLHLLLHRFIFLYLSFYLKSNVFFQNDSDIKAYNFQELVHLLSDPPNLLQFCPKRYLHRVIHLVNTLSVLTRLQVVTGNILQGIRQDIES